MLLFVMTRKCGTKSSQGTHTIYLMIKIHKMHCHFSPNSFGLLYNYTRYGIPTKYGNKYYISINSGLQNQAIIYSLNSLDDTAGKVFIDPNTFSADGTVSLVFTSFSSDGKYCAFGKSEGGSDWITIEVKNVETGEILPEKLNKIKFAYVGWNKNNQGFFYAVSCCRKRRWRLTHDD